jgi:hypothetical protein
MCDVGGMGWPLGVVDVVFAPEAVEAAAGRAAALRFDHLDITDAWSGDPAALPIAIGDRMAFPSPRPHCSHPAPPAGEGVWDRAVAAYRRCPGVRIEPWGDSICGSIEGVRALLEAVPGARLLVDVGHVVAWGEDPVELLPWADHVQLRQARRNEVQVHPDESGDVDVAAVLAALARLDYQGRLSVEYFDLPEHGWGLPDPVECAVAFASRVRPMLH